MPGHPLHSALRYPHSTVSYLLSLLTQAGFVISLLAVKKVLVVAYYTPPLGMSGVMRVTKLVKYLPSFGWEPLVLTVRKVAYYHYDEQLLKDWQGIKVFRTRSLDPARVRHLILPGKRLKAGSTGRSGRLANILCFPDSKVGWYPFAFEQGGEIIHHEHPDAVFATAPPFTALMVGSALKKFSGLPLVTDFRDPWPTGFVPPPRLLRARVERCRTRILKASDAVLAVNQGTAAFLDNRAEILENGFDPEEFVVPPRRFEGFNIVHVGNVWENERELLAVLDTTSNIKGSAVRLVGKLPRDMERRLKRYPHFTNLGLMSHAETLAAMKGADLLLYLSKPGQAAGIKLYEYLGAGRPILSVCDEPTEAAELVTRHHAGVAITSNPEVITRTIQEAIEGVLPFAPTGIEHYSRKVQAERLAGILNRVTE